MDPISAAASIVSVAELVMRVVDYLHTVKQGGFVRKKLQDETLVLWLGVSTLRRQFDPVPASLDEPWMEPLQVLLEPGGVMQQMREVLEELESKLKGRPSKLGQAWLTLCWPFEEKEAQKIIDRIHRLSTTANLAVSQSSHQLNREMIGDIGKIKTMAENSHFQTVMDWLSPLSFPQKQEEVLAAADRDAYAWVVESDEYRAWHDGDVRSLWYYGAPGAGKSVLASSIYAELATTHKAENVAVMIAFCSWDNDASQNARSIAASLLKQLLQVRADGHLPPQLQELHSRSTLGKDGKQPELTVINQLIRSSLASFDAAFIILDGLDEAGSNNGRAEIVETIHSYGPATKVLITSRQLDDISNALRDTLQCTTCGTKDAGEYWRCRKCKTFVLCQDDHAKSLAAGDHKHQTARELPQTRYEFRPRETDIRQYVERRLERDLQPGLGAHLERCGLKESTVDTVVEKSQDVFLLARFHMNRLVDCMTVTELRNATDDLSGDLTETYSEALHRIKRSLEQHQGRYRAMQKLLLWVAWAERPLSIQELKHALATHPGITSIENGDTMDIRLITTWSAGLLFVDGKELVRLIHPTAGRYFSDHRDELYPNGDSIIAHACLDYLNMAVLCQTFSGPDKISRSQIHRAQFPFVEYSVVHSSAHIERSAGKDDDLRVAQFLQSDALPAFLQALYFLDPGWEVESGASALHIAAYLGLTDVLSRLLDGGAHVDEPDATGATALMYGALRGDDGVDLVDRLLCAGADAALTDRTGATALIRAVVSGSEKVVDRLLKQDEVNINAIPANYAVESWTIDMPALILAVRDRLPGIVHKLLARKDIDVNRGSNNGSNALQLACESGMMEGVKALLGHADIDVDAPYPEDNWTALFLAVVNRRVECVDLLLDHGARLDHVDCHQGTALMRAADYGAAEMARYLIRRGICVDARDALGRTALHSAAMGEAWDVLEVLLQDAKDLQVNAQGDAGETALHDACESSDTTGTRLLIAAGARCDIQDRSGRTALDIATLYKLGDTLEVLKTARGYQSQKDLGPRRAKTLAEAVEWDPYDVLVKRIQLASPDELNTAGSAFDGMPLHVACRHQRADVARLLLEAGADVDAIDYFRRTPLFLAIEAESLPCVEVVVAHGADLGRTPSSQYTLWEYACREMSYAIAFYLLERGATIASTSVYLQAALQQAVSADNVAAAKRLVEAGASIHLKDSHGQTSIMRAEASGATNVLAYLSELEARNGS